MTALTHLLAALLAVAAVGPPAAPARASPVYRRLVVANTYAVHWSTLSARPSGEISFFLGSSMRPRLRPRGGVWTTALGYELTASVGASDLMIAYLSFGGDYGLFYHRHHLTAVGFGARNDRLYYAFGGGLLFYGTTPTALEVDAKLGCVLGIRRQKRLRGMVGAQARIVGVINGVPMPQFGLFAGWMLF